VLAAVTFDFDPTINPFGLDVRLETLALAGVILFVLVVAAFSAGRAQAALARTKEAGAERRPIRRDDLLLIAFGAVPGAIVGARIDYGLIHYDYFSQDWGRLFDPGQGGLSLTLAVVLGTVTAIAVAFLVAAPISRWLHLAAVPLLLGLGLGKLVMLLGGDGQGRFSDSSWAVSFTGQGPWQSLNPDVPALPSQALEGVLVLLAALALIVVPFCLRLRLRRWRRLLRPGLAPSREIGLLSGYRLFLAAVWLWAAIRLGVAFTWRDALVLGPLNAEQLILAGALALLTVIGLAAWLLGRRRRRQTGEAAAGPKDQRAGDLARPKRDLEPVDWLAEAGPNVSRSRRSRKKT
jgi:prolipoprotein diacylglyceryltransferase